MPEATNLAEALAGRTPMTVAEYMDACNAHYYAARDPLGAEGDFTTAPEVSQMFGELIGLWFADLWLRAGRPELTHYVELGPGRGTLAVDALRAMRGAGLEPPVHLVETSPALRRAQAERVPAARWHESIHALPERGPLLIVANEFFDALPVRQFVRAGERWRELVVEHREGRFVRVAGPTAEGEFPDAPEGTVIERSPASLEVVRQLAERLAAQGGSALIVDYGPDRSATGDTLQAVSRHRYADPFEAPGARDLTAHADFEALGAAARAGGARVAGIRTQGQWLDAMGIHLRAAALAKAAPERTEEIVAARERLTSPSEMGILFKVVGLVGAGWPEPEGF